MFKWKKNLKRVSALIAISLSLFGLQTIFVDTASASCVGFCITYPLSPADGGSTIFGTVGVPFNLQVLDTGGTDPITATVWPVPIPGLIMSPTGFLSGTPTVSGLYHCTIGITDSAAHYMQENSIDFFIFSTPPAPVPSSLPPPAL